MKIRSRKSEWGMRNAEKLKGERSKAKGKLKTIEKAFGTYLGINI